MVAALAAPRRFCCVLVHHSIGATADDMSFDAAVAHVVEGIDLHRRLDGRPAAARHDPHQRDAGLDIVAERMQQEAGDRAGVIRPIFESAPISVIP